MKQTLALQTGRIQRPQKAVIYGPEGIGKSTLASQFPSPIFLDTEGGTHHLNVTRFPVGTGWADVTRAIAWLVTEAHDFKTLVVDTADWLEKLLVDFICQRDNKTSVEDFGYGMLRSRFRLPAAHSRCGCQTEPRLNSPSSHGANLPATCSPITTILP